MTKYLICNVPLEQHMEAFSDLTTISWMTSFVCDSQSRYKSLLTNESVL